MCVFYCGVNVCVYNTCVAVGRDQLWISPNTTLGCSMVCVMYMGARPRIIWA